jgi:uncharacterized membrane protein
MALEIARAENGALDMFILRNILKGKRILMIFIGALLLRLARIGRYDLWFDELISNFYSYNSAQVFYDKGVPFLKWFFKYCQYDPVSIFYYILVYVYSIIFGDGLYLRYLSVFASMLALIVFYRFMRLFFDRKACFYGTLIMAVSPVQIWYAQEARVYAVSVFLGLLAIYSCLKALKTGKTVYFAAFSVSCACAFYASYFFGLFLPAIILIIFSHENCKKNLIKFALSAFFSVILVMPILFMLKKHAGIVSSGFWLPAPELKHLLNTFTFFMFGYSSPMWQIRTAPVLLIGLYAYGIYSCFKSGARNAVLFLLLFIFPIVTCYLISRYIMPVYIYRQLLIFSPFYYMILAYGLTQIRINVVKSAVIIFLVIYFGVSIGNYYTGYEFCIQDIQRSLYPCINDKKIYRDSLAYIEQNLKDGDIIVSTDGVSFFIVSLYFRDIMFQYSALRIGYLFYSSQIESLAITRAICDRTNIYEAFYDTDELYGILRNQKGIQKKGRINWAEIECDRLWVVSSMWYSEAKLSPNSVRIRNDAMGQFKHQLSIGREGIFVDLFERPSKKD